MSPRCRRHLTMPQKALLHDPDLVGIAPVSPTRDIRGRKDLDLGSELMVGHKVGLIIAVEIPSDGRRRRLTFRNQKAYTFLIEPEEGMLRYRDRFRVSPSSPRLDQAMRFLRDVKLIDDAGLTDFGRAELMSNEVF